MSTPSKSLKVSEAFILPSDYTLETFSRFNHEELLDDSVTGLIRQALEGTNSTLTDVMAMLRGGLLKAYKIMNYYVIGEILEEKGKKIFYLWLTVTKSPTGENFKESLDVLETAVQKEGCKSIHFRTSRKGFEKKMPAGWGIQAYWWKKEFAPSDRIYH